MKLRFTTYYCKHLLFFLLALLAGSLDVNAQTFTFEAEDAYNNANGATIFNLDKAAAKADYGTSPGQCGEVSVRKSSITDKDGNAANVLCFDGFATGMYYAKYTVNVTTAGTYNVVAYCIDPNANRYFTFQANDDAPRAVKVELGSSSWYKADGRAYFQVNLDAGDNTLYLGGMYRYTASTGITESSCSSPFIDKFVFTKASSSVTMPSASTSDDIPMKDPYITINKDGEVKQSSDVTAFKYVPFWSLQNNGNCTFTYNAPAAGYYLLNFVYGRKDVYNIKVKVNDDDYKIIAFPSNNDHTTANFCRQVLVKLNASDNTITLDANGNWSPWIDFMFFTRVVPDNFTYESPGTTYSSEYDEINMYVKLKAADDTDLGYLDSNLKLATDKSNAEPLTLKKNLDGTYYIMSGTNYVGYNLFGVIYKDEAGNYYRAGDWTTTYSSPQFQYYDGFEGTTTESYIKKTYPRLGLTDREYDFSTNSGNYNRGTEVVYTDADKTITAYKGAWAWRLCRFRIMADGKVSFILKDDVFTNNSQPMSKTNALACSTSPYTEYGYTFVRPLYFTTLQSDDGKGTGTTEDILYPIVDESQAVSLVFEEPDYGFVHSQGVVYTGMGTDIPSDLQYTSGNYKTHADDPRINEGVTLQRTHEYTHEIYLFPGKSYTLTPFTDFYSQTTKYCQKYTRWYDYCTDKKSSRLTALSGENLLSIDDGGLFGAGVLTAKASYGARVTYTSVESEDKDKDTLDIIAIDVSNNPDFTLKNNRKFDSDKLIYNIVEPTLQFRHLFVVKNAKTRADEMTTSVDDNQAYVKDRKITLMCPADVPFQYQLQYPEPTSGNSDFWYKKQDGTYAQVARYRIETFKDGVSQGSTTYTNAACSTFAEENFYAYKNLNNQNRVIYMRKPKAGHTYTAKIYAIDSSKNDICIAGTSTPIELMEYDLEVLAPENGNMITEEDLNNSDNDAKYAHQRPARMKELYGDPTTVVNFDGLDLTKDCTETTYTTIGTTTYSGYYYKWPWKWESSSYAFGYNKYMSYDYNMYLVANNVCITPYHGKFMKNGVSSKNSRGSYDPTGLQEYDRLYYDTYDSTTGTGTQGFFFYANAASDPSRMAELNIGQDFCAGTRVYVSAWIMEMSQSEESANVVFSFRGVDKDGNETILNSFVSGYVPGGYNTKDGYQVGEITKNGDQVISTPDCRGKWMHVYYTFTSESSASGFDHYIITLENNCTSSAGADYAIDDIQAYVRKPSVTAQQQKPVCNGSVSTNLKLSGDFDSLMKSFSVDEDDTESGNKTSFYYCFLDKETYDSKLSASVTAAGYSSYSDWAKVTGTAEARVAAYKAAFDAALVKKSYGSSNDNYGILTFNNYYMGNPEYVAADVREGTAEKYVAQREESGGARNLIFPGYAEDTNLRVNKQYIVALCEDMEASKTTAENFEITSACARTSIFKVIFSGEVKIDGEASAEQDGQSVCANQDPVVSIDLNGITDNGDIYTTGNAYFDWYHGRLSEYTAYKDPTTNASLYEAMGDLRLFYPTAKETDLSTVVAKDNGTNYLTDDEIKMITELVTSGKLELYKQTATLSTWDEYDKVLGVDEAKYNYLTIIPFKPADIDTKAGGATVNFCLEAFEVWVKVSTRTPRMKNGDDSGRIPYPSDMESVPLRIGLAQLNKARIDNLDATTTSFLYMPLRDVTPATTGVASLVQKSLDDYVYLISSTDPDVAAGKSGAVDVVGYTKSDIKVIGKVSNITADCSTKGSVCHLAFLKDFKFREGYEYQIKFMFEENYSGVTADHSDVCPGRVLCTIKVVPEYQKWTGAVDANWNNDGNWSRVTRADLLNPTSIGSDYTTDGTTNDNESSYVPADFTKVIIPANTTNPPRLYNLRTGTASEEPTDATTNRTIVKYAGNPYDSYYIKDMTENETSYIGDATTDIKYDMSSIDLTEGTDAGNVACRSWYDHTCKYVHFNSEAQMLSQQYLNYEKAWTDFEMVPNKWTTISTPLAGVVAGDFYLPTASARQETPLFEDITFDASLHDRFHPAIFQRTWNAKDAKVVRLSEKDTIVAVSLNWSQVYNDVNVDYSAGVGLAIKPDVSMMDSAVRPDTVKFRLPKADLTYYYWNPNHQDGTTKSERVTATLAADNTRLHRLADFTSGNFAQATEGQSGATATKYFLVGNPMMCYLNMTEFFAANTNLEPKYWIVTGKGQQYAALDDKTEGYVGSVDGTYIAPFQSFFVALKSDQTEAATFQPKFNTDMMAVKLVNATNNSATYSTPSDEKDDPTGTTPTTANAPMLNICATDSLGFESSLILTEGMEDQITGIETLFDSNLQMSGVPTLYTNKNGEAMSLTQIQQGDTIPVILSGARNEVTIKISGIENMESPLYLIDAETGETSELTNDVILRQSANGIRYYVTTGIGDVPSEASLPRLVIDKCTLTVYASANEPITDLNIYSVAGALVARAKDITQSYSVTLSEGVFLVNIVTPTYHNTVKIYLHN